jgi:hypothetical protein
MTGKEDAKMLQTLWDLDNFEWSDKEFKRHE